MYRRCLEVNVQDRAEVKAKEISGAPKPVTPGTDATIGDIVRAYEAKASVFIRPATVRVDEGGA